MYTKISKEDTYNIYYLVKGEIMSLLEETCGTIIGRSHEIEQHIIDSWNMGSPIEQYGRLVNV